MKFIRYFTAADQSARFSTFFTVTGEKSVLALIGQLAIPLFSLLTVKKWNSELIGQSGVCELLPGNRRNDENLI